MAVPAYEHYTPEEYLEYERQAEYKHEYIDGQIVAMSGASKEHNRISSNVNRVLGTQLLNQPCDVFTADMRVQVRDSNVYTYPDVTIVCGDLQVEDNHGDSLLNPTVLIEVLSASTENYDRGAKFAYYRNLQSLQEYLLIAQDRVHVEHYIRTGTGWYFTTSNSLDEVLSMPSIECELPLSQVYRRVFPSPEQSIDGGADYNS